MLILSKAAKNWDSLTLCGMVGQLCIGAYISYHPEINLMVWLVVLELADT